MKSAQYHEERLMRSKLYQRRELAARRAQSVARVRALNYLEPGSSGRIWVVEPEPLDRREEWLA